VCPPARLPACLGYGSPECRQCSDDFESVFTTWRAMNVVRLLLPLVAFALVLSDEQVSLLRPTRAVVACIPSELSRISARNMRPCTKRALMASVPPTCGQVQLIPAEQAPVGEADIVPDVTSSAPSAVRAPHSTEPPPPPPPPPCPRLSASKQTFFIAHRCPRGRLQLPLNTEPPAPL
jgi:hypothetical protein